MKKGAKFEVKPINIHQATTLFLTIVKYYKLMPGKLGRFYPVVKGLRLRLLLCTESEMDTITFVTFSSPAPLFPLTNIYR